MTKPGEPLAHFEAAMLLDTDDCILWPFAIDCNGYPKMRYQGRVHHPFAVACERVHGPRPTSAHQAAHGPCHNPLCFNGRHLSWKTPQENEADKIRDGTALRGARHHHAKLTAERVLELRSRRANGESLKSLAADFEVAVSTVHAVATGKLWGWL